MKDGNWELFEAFLNQHDGDTWTRVIDSLLPSIHEVDKNAIRIWMAFYPIDLALAIKASDDAPQLIDALQILGKYDLADQIDSSHTFVYGHRYWPAVKKAIVAQATSPNPNAAPELAAHIRQVASTVAKEAGVDASLVIGITAAGFMTLQQVGLQTFSREPGKVLIDRKHADKSAEQVLKERHSGSGQGLFGFLRGDNKVWNVTFNENVSGACFKLIDSQDLTSAAAKDTRHYTPRDPKLFGSVGPIPVQCRSAACGTCWVGVLSGAANLSDVDRLEGRRIKDFGYINTNDPKPIIRLACRSMATGPVSIVIPPWNGVFGKYLKKRKENAAEEAEKTL